MSLIHLRYALARKQRPVPRAHGAALPQASSMGRDRDRLPKVLGQAAWLLWISACTAVVPAAEPTRSLSYEQHIRPIFRAHCFDCHGAVDEIQGGLDLRLVRLMTQGGESGPAIVPGQPEQSFLLQRIQLGEMPPGEHKVSAAEIATIADWLRAGAPTARAEPETIGSGLGITEEERSFWSFQPIRRPVIGPLTGDATTARVRTPIDALLWNTAPQPATFGPDADRRTLVKRLYFDLLGLPPTPAELQRWLSDASPDWYDRLLNELLDSPHYGERWARHWLDIAGYADSDGYHEADAIRPWAWKYRDWVIRALNADLPFDRFVTEQLAGDELAGPRDGDLSARQIELLTATGFLRMAADGTGSGADHAEARNQVMTDTLKIIGTSLLGLSVQCAQCHDHRYDPIPQADYYALRAVFEPALDWQAWQVPAARLVSLATANERARAAEVETEAQQIAAERATKEAEYLAQALEQELQKFEEPLRATLRTAVQTASDARTPEQQQLLASHPSLSISPGVLYQYLPKAAEDLKQYDQRIAEVRGKKPPEEFLQTLIEPAGHLPDTRLFYRGDYRQPRQSVSPGGLSVATPAESSATFVSDDPSLPTTGRRLAFAGWLTSRDNPLFARVIVNRVWAHHFGQGLVATPADFGRLGAAPRHPELLDWLADEFMTQGWSLKRLHRLILSSTVWRQSNEESGAAAPATLADNSTVSISLETTEPSQAIYPLHVRRLDAEAIRDRMLSVTGQLDRSLFGPPLEIKEDDTGQVVVSGQQTRRSLYIQCRRSRPVAMLQAFDAPVMETNCEVRPSSTVATQSLMLINGEFILAQAEQLAARAAREPATLDDAQRAVLTALPPESREDLGRQIVRSWELTFCRTPSPAELTLAAQFLVEQQATIVDSAERPAARQAMTNLCQTLLSANEFLYLE